MSRNKWNAGRLGLAAVLLGAVLSGCASTNTHPEPAEAPLEKLISEKLVISAKAQSDYSALITENTRTLTRRQQDLDVGEPVDVDFIGKPQELLMTFAYRYGYRYIETGKRAELHIINVRVVNQPPQEVLRSIGQQVDNGADVELDRPAKIVRLIYKNQSTKG